MEISQPSIGIFYISKVLALAPYATVRNSKGRVEIGRSWLFTVYSATLTVVMVFLTYRGLLFDANSEIPVRASFRMKSATSKVVTALDVSVVVMAIVSGVYCGLFSLNDTLELNDRLNKIDNTLNAYNNFRRDRWRALGMAAVSLLAISILVGLDVGTWMRIAQDMNIAQSDTELNVHWYIPFYSLYFILTGLQVNIANTAYGLGRRFGRLNRMLSSSFLAENNATSAIKPQKVSTVKNVSVNRPAMPSALHASLTKLNGETLPSEAAGDKAAARSLILNVELLKLGYFPAKNKGLLLKSLADSHESLGKCVHLLSNSFGIAVLFILVSCLLHLVATAYFLFLELLSKRDNGYLWVQMLWICFHFLRLLMVVEPCHLAARESRKTIQIVCEIERKVHEPILAEAVKKFWQQLLVVDADFSACGLCRVNRTILTSFASAIATYLVILIQFQRTNG
uniref:Gustatory receptor n=2 Tax=Drosophila melanogaster TaxID=7227 RepID=A0A0B4LEE5_DROME|nr:gustatory receptor 43a, isoform C [Drosophila melanogaster]AHN55956.1 gustatory receptor 43a, isoform C [Drosophila melanogaster]|eukprot:NP_001286158.1 gustatory receptor 43a, isoform C [Drosophila melanogaster]